MSWSDGIARFGRLAFLLGGAALVLAACIAVPVYEAGAPGGSVAGDLAAIAIESPDDEVEQEVRNRLDFAFTGGGEAAPARYALALATTVSESQLGVTPIQTAPSYSVTVAVSYELSDIATGRIVTRGVARGVATYDRSNQLFANERARTDAEFRAAGSAADDIRLRLAAALATDA